MVETDFEKRILQSFQTWRIRIVLEYKMETWGGKPLLTPCKKPKLQTANLIIIVCSYYAISDSFYSKIKVSIAQTHFAKSSFLSFNSKDNIIKSKLN